MEGERNQDRTETAVVCPNGHTRIKVDGKLQIKIDKVTINVDGVEASYPSVHMMTLSCTCEVCGAAFTVKV